MLLNFKAISFDGCIHSVDSLFQSQKAVLSPSRLDAEILNTVEEHRILLSILIEIFRHQISKESMCSNDYRLEIIVNRLMHKLKY